MRLRHKDATLKALKAIQDATLAAMGTHITTEDAQMLSFARLVNRIGYANCDFALVTITPKAGAIVIPTEAGKDDIWPPLFKKAPRPEIVCLCGSTRFTEAFRKANLDLTIAGKIVLSVGCDTKSDSDLLALGELTAETKAALDELHKRKIDLADRVLVLNVGGYIGDSTRSEISYAMAADKPVDFLEPLRAEMTALQEGGA